jgi:hypothetical protein
VSERLRTVVWAKDEPFGAEHADVRLVGTTLSAQGVAIGSAPAAYRLDYRLETADDYVTRRLQVRTVGDGWQRALDLWRDEGGWHVQARAEGESLLPPPGGDVGRLAPALDCDLGLSPLTNTMPVLRHAFFAAGPQELLTAWVSVPDLGVHPSAQRYSSVGPLPDGGHLVRFESLDVTFTADIAFDADGVVVDYPRIGRRV